jgi:hypothetical protein
VPPGNYVFWLSQAVRSLGPEKSRRASPRVSSCSRGKERIWISRSGAIGPARRVSCRRIISEASSCRPWAMPVAWPLTSPRRMISWYQGDSSKMTISHLNIC